MGNRRYITLASSYSAHCCFEASVLDIQRPDEFSDPPYKAICECMTMIDAEIIWAALNAAEEGEKT